jgi:choline kinase
MIGLILAAGKGSRLKQLTANTPKSLLELRDGFSMLDYNVEMLKEIGVDHIYVVTGFAKEKIEERVLAYNDVSISTIYNPFWDKCNVLGSLYIALPYLKDDFYFLHADTLADKSIWITLKTAQGKIVLPYEQKKCGEEEMKVEFDGNGKLINISKEIPSEKAEGEFLGIAKFSGSLIPYLQTTAERLFSEGELNLYMEAAVQVAIEDDTNIGTFEIGESDFVEVDFQEDYSRAVKMFGE